MLERLNPTVLGCALNVIGLFFLASTISFKRPRRQIEELLGVERPHSLLAARERLVNQIQTYLGFAILVVGFVLVMGDALDRNRAATPAAEHDAAPLVWIVALLVAATLATTMALKLIKEGYVRSKFRRLLREVVRDSKFNLEKNPQLSVQIGKLLHIPEQPDQSVADYISKVRAALGIPSAPTGSASNAGLAGSGRSIRPLSK